MTITVIISYGKLARKLEPNGKVFTVHPPSIPNRYMVLVLVSGNGIFVVTPSPSRQKLVSLDAFCLLFQVCEVLSNHHTRPSWSLYKWMMRWDFWLFSSRTPKMNENSRLKEILPFETSKWKNLLLQIVTCSMISKWISRNHLEIESVWPSVVAGWRWRGIPFSAIPVATNKDS
jgi:hypothetical protein